MGLKSPCEGQRIARSKSIALVVLWGHTPEDLGRETREPSHKAEDGAPDPNDTGSADGELPQERATLKDTEILEQKRQFNERCRGNVAAASNVEEMHELLHVGERQRKKVLSKTDVDS